MDAEDIGRWRDERPCCVSLQFHMRYSFTNPGSSTTTCIDAPLHTLGDERNEESG